MFVFILAVFLIPYGVVTTALLYPNENRLSESMEGIFFKQGPKTKINIQNSSIMI